MPEPQPPPSTPKVIGGRFRVDRLLGRGGMGEVWAARNVTTGRDVALKMIIGSGGAEQTRRFLREAKAATAIQHPNVIEVLDVFEDEDGTPVMVMELLRGEPLSALRKRRSALPLHEVATILVPVVGALRAAHQKGIVHRDLKPDNIFLSEPLGGGAIVPKVLDFGIAKLIDPTSISGETQGGATNTGSILGTPHYMAMEQAMSEKDVDHRADIWAMGVILFEALTGRRPLVFENLGEMYTAFLQKDVPSIRDAIPELPEDVAAIVDRCLHKQREGRLDDLGPLVDALSRYTNPDTPGARAGGTVVGDLALSGTRAPTTAALARTAPAEARPAAKRLTTRALAGVSVAVALGGIAVIALRPGSARPPLVTPSAEPVASQAPEPAVAPSGSAATVLPSAAAPPATAPGSAVPPPRVGPQHSGPRTTTAASAAPITAPASAPRKGIEEKLPY